MSLGHWIGLTATVLLGVAVGRHFGVVDGLAAAFVFVVLAPKQPQ